MPSFIEGLQLGVGIFLAFAFSAAFSFGLYFLGHWAITGRWK